MAPLKDETVEALRDTIHQLESRVQQLEAKLGSTGGNASSRGSRSNSDSVRMILMGPPGAGKEVGDTHMGLLADCVARQGYTGTKDQGQILRLPLGILLEFAYLQCGNAKQYGV